MESHTQAQSHRTAAPHRTPLSIAPATLAQLQDLYDRGLMLQAHALAEQCGPLAAWSGCAAQTLAGRLATNLGAMRLGAILHWQAWRVDKHNPDLIAYQAHNLRQRRGPLATWLFLETYATGANQAGANELGHLFTVRALVASELRDFTTAQLWFGRAAQLIPNHPWLATTESSLLEHQDRYAEALAAAQRALDWQPWYRPGVQAAAHALQLLDRDAEALSLLTEAMAHLENCHVARQLALLQKELGCFDKAADTLKRFVTWAPLMEKHERHWLQREQVTLACYGGHLDLTLAQARAIDEPFYRELTQRLASGAPQRQVRLDVPFVRQHHQTCAPATLSALSQFWHLPAEHLEIAEAICYDGTPGHNERRWAESHGWAVREFAVTWEAALALLNRGVPFTLTTEETTSAHLQAVIGFDELRQTLWIRDPFLYYATEVPAKILLERYRATGPRGMAMVPLGQRDLLADIAFPDAVLYDQLYAVQSALMQHRRADAAAAAERMRASAPAHRLTLAARRALAAYDGHLPALLQVLDELLALFPQDGHLILSKLNCLHELARRQERLDLLEQMIKQPGTDAIFWRQYAQELRADARELPAASSWVRWALRNRPVDPDLLSAWADLLWDQREFARATLFYRLAACLGEKREPFSRSYFVASRHLRETDAALLFLKERWERLGALSADPAITLIEALQQLERAREAFELLAAALARRPEDGALALFAAEFHGRFAQFEAASRWLQAAQSRCSQGAWHRAAARLADYQNDKSAALEHWRSVLQWEPLAHDAIRATAFLLAETQGRTSALAFLHELCERYPFSCPLLVLRLEWLKDEDGVALIPALRQLLDVNPAEAWAWRELALQLKAKHQAGEALNAAHEAIRLEPHRSQGYCVRADILTHQDRLADAQLDLKTAVALEVDNHFAVVNYVARAPSLAERQNALAFVADQLRRQVIFQDALFAYRDAARGILPAAEVLALLREAHRFRPDLWQAWSVLINQLIDATEYGEALALAREATSRFPLLPRLWLDLARLERAQLNAAGEIAALAKALEINPAFATAARLLAEVHARQNDLARARVILEQAIAATPLDPQNHFNLAEILWKLGERDLALQRMRHALTLEPGYDWAWNCLREWETEANQPGLALELARELTRRRAGEARSWLLLARCLSPQDAPGELFPALDRALQLNPRYENAYDYRALALAELNRFDEALAACAPPVLNPLPPKLLWRAAWVEAQRGNRAQAIARLETALSEHPDYYEGWQFLSDLKEKNQDLDGAVQAAEKMAPLAPLNPVPLGYLAELKLKLGDQPGAQAALERAFTLDPDYEYAGWQLFRLYLNAKNLAAADQTLGILRRQGESPSTLAGTIQLAVARAQPDQALAVLAQLCAHADATETSLAVALEALDHIGHCRAVDRVLNTAVRAGCPTPAPAIVWVARQTGRQHWNLHQEMAALEANRDVRRLAILRYLDMLGEAFQAAARNQDITAPIRLRFHFWRLMRRHRDWLRTDVEGWGKVGFVLGSIGKPQPVIDWLSDWSQRPEASSWMLYNLVLMLHKRRRYDDAANVIRHAVAMRHDTELYTSFHLWAAFEEGLAGHVDLARQHLADLPVAAVNESDRPVHCLAELLVALRSAPPPKKREFIGSVRDKLRTSFGNLRPFQAERYTRDAYRRFVAMVASELNSRRFRLWGEWYYYGPRWIPLLFFVAGSLPICYTWPAFFPVPLFVVIRFLRRGALIR